MVNTSTNSLCTALATVLLSACLVACKNDPPVQIPDTRPDLVKTAEVGQKKADFLSHENVSFDLMLTQEGKPGLQASVLQRTDGTRIRVQKSNGSTLLFDGANGWLVSNGQPDPNARFDLFTWHYFFCLPWKLSDPGTHWQILPDRTLEGRDCHAARLTFGDGTGDSPNDWFVVFTDRQEGCVRAAIYIVTFGSLSVEAAAKEPRAIFYDDFRSVEGIPIAHRWTFYEWNTEGLEGKKRLGSAVISNVRFSEETEAVFAVPEGAAKM